jgi:hypothetical protein
LDHVQDESLFSNKEIHLSKKIRILAIV